MIAATQRKLKSRSEGLAFVMWHDSAKDEAHTGPGLSAPC